MSKERKFKVIKNYEFMNIKVGQIYTEDEIKEEISLHFDKLIDEQRLKKKRVKLSIPRLEIQEVENE